MQTEYIVQASYIADCIVRRQKELRLRCLEPGMQKWGVSQIVQCEAVRICIERKKKKHFIGTKFVRLFIVSFTVKQLFLHKGFPGIFWRPNFLADIILKGSMLGNILSVTAQNTIYVYFDHRLFTQVGYDGWGFHHRLVHSQGQKELDLL